MTRAFTILFVLASITLTGWPAYSAGDPFSSKAVLSFIGEDSVEIRYFGDKTHPRANGRNDTLDALTFPQTLLTAALVAAIPASPINPILVDAALAAAGLPRLNYTSCWPDDGAFVLIGTAPLPAVDAALDAAGSYYDPNRHPREFAEAYWKKLFQYKDTASEHTPGLPGDLPSEVIKEGIVDILPFPTNLAPMTTYQGRGIVPFMYIKGKWVQQCFIICWTVPRCVVRWNPVSEGYGLPGVK